MRISKFFRRNDRIRAKTVRLIDDEEAQIGITSIEKALEMARERELDLVEVAPNANPPVCKIMDFGKFVYKQKKLEQKQKKASKQHEVKGIRISMRIDTHDMQIKAEKAISFLKERNPVRVSMMMKGRENAYHDLAREKMHEFAKMLVDVGEIETAPKRQGNTFMMTFRPK